MSTIIRPGDPLYDTLLVARYQQGADLVQLGSAETQQWYQFISDVADYRFILVERRPEKSSLGRPDKRHAAPYPPEVGPNGE